MCEYVSVLVLATHTCTRTTNKSKCIKASSSHLLAEDLVLDAHDGRDKNVVAGLGFDADVELLDAEGEAADELLVGAADESQAWLAEAVVLAERLDDSDLGGRYGEQALLGGGQCGV